MEVERIADGLWRWTTAHPEWRPTADWPVDVGCVYWEAESAIVLVDPLVPADAAERERFLTALDRDVRRAALPVEILLTCAWHERSVEELAARYGTAVRRGAEGDLPAGLARFEVPVAQEVVYWLAGAAAVVPGDVLLGADGGLTMAPESWLEGRGDLAQLARELAPLLELPVQRVLTSHGPPVLEGGREALAQALGAA